MKKIAWIGTGVMGKPMALHLAKNGHNLTVYNRTHEKALALKEHCEVATSIAEAVKDADVIFTIVGMPYDVEEVYFGNNNIFDNAKQGAILIDMTTSSPTLAKRIAEEAIKKGMHSLDSPVTGGDLGAINGTLSVMVGGSEDIFNSVEPLIKCFSKAITYMGEAGNGQYAKLTNQMCIAGAIVSTAEALTFASSKGLDLNKMLNVINNGSAQSWQAQNMGPKMVEGNYDPGFFIKHFVKDLRLGIEESSDVNTSLTQLALEQYEKLIEFGYEDKGTQAILDFYKLQK